MSVGIAPIGFNTEKTATNTVTKNSIEDNFNDACIGWIFHFLLLNIAGTCPLLPSKQAINVQYNLKTITSPGLKIYQSKGYMESVIPVIERGK
jgi:hypothetical protein